MFVDGPNVPATGSMVVKVFERFGELPANGRIDHASNTIVDESFVVRVVARYTVNSALLDVPPPGAGLKTETGTVPMVTKSLDASVVLSELLLMYVVGRSTPAHRMIDSEEKPVPLTVKVTPVDRSLWHLG
jgi:hypothetical protein